MDTHFRRRGAAFRRAVHNWYFLALLGGFVLPALPGRAVELPPEYEPSVFVAHMGRAQTGDVIEVHRFGREELIILAGIDCPERDQPYGRLARQFVNRLVADDLITVEERGRGRRGQILAEVFLPDGRSLNRELVRAGLAWWYRPHSTDESLGSAEEEARKERRGLWADPEPVPPWKWRRARRGSQ